MIVFKEDLTKENVLNKVSDENIFRHYCSNFGKRRFKSEFRDDKSPSCSFYYSFKWYYKDFGSGELLDCFDYIMKKYCLSFSETLNKINNDFGLNLGGSSNSPKSSLQVNSSIKKETVLSRTIINVKYRDFDRLDNIYWSQGYIKEELISKYYVFPIKWYEVIKSEYDFYVREPKDLAYTQNFYKDELNIFRRKIYRPNSNIEKWTSNITPLVVPGIKHIDDYGDLLIITKSVKDLLVFVTLGYKNTISVNNETSFMPLKVFNNLKSRFKTIVLFYDNDETGVLQATKISEKYNINKLFFFDTEAKDAFDTIKKYGKKETSSFIKDKIKELHEGANKSF